MKKRPMSLVVDGLQTTSEKIPAHLREGYLRTEVRDFLDIRYQYVRKVAVDAGMEGGLQRGILVLPEPKALARVREDVAIELLVDAGFTLLGSWVSTEAGMALARERRAIPAFTHSRSVDP